MNKSYMHLTLQDNTCDARQAHSFVHLNTSKLLRQVAVRRELLRDHQREATLGLLAERRVRTELALGLRAELAQLGPRAELAPVGLQLRPVGLRL